MFSTPVALLTQAPEFSLPGVDGRRYSLSDFKDAKVLVVTFMCNHCPYVKATQGRINDLARRTAQQGVRFVAINSNDATRYPDDSFEQMKIVAKEWSLVFPYLHDESQAVAKAYNAACTPEFFAYENQGGKFLLKYQGRLDDNWKDEKAVTRHELAEALECMVEGKSPALEQIAAIGCGIKWFL